MHVRIIISPSPQLDCNQLKPSAESHLSYSQTPDPQTEKICVLF